MKFEKLACFLKYLELGHELQIGGLNYVWLNNHVTHTIDGVNYGIDGLAVKSRRITMGEQKSDENVYIGRQDIPLNMLLEVVEDMSHAQYKHIKHTLKKHRQK